MSDKDFKALLCDVIRRDNYGQKARVLELLSRSNLVSEKTETFAGKPYPWNSLIENIYIVSAPADVSELLDFKKYIQEKIKQIYPVDTDYVFYGFEIKPGAVMSDESISQEIHFEDIEQQVIAEIRNAKYLIWVAMAWFTNRKIYDELVVKKQQGLNIQIIVDDNQKNRDANFVLEDEFETHRVCVESYYKNIMHDKFCIIDLQTVVHGTFNWTNAANYNKETISVDRNSATARTFADEFIKLKTSGRIFTSLF